MLIYDNSSRYLDPSPVLAARFLIISLGTVFMSYANPNRAQKSMNAVVKLVV